MKTGQDVRQLGLYVSECCLQEILFDKNGSFRRCPRCGQLCEWELVDAVMSGQEIAERNSNAHEAA
jgi:hypothetical protein